MASMIKAQIAAEAKERHKAAITRGNKTRHEIANSNQLVRIGENEQKQPSAPKPRQAIDSTKSTAEVVIHTPPKEPKPSRFSGGGAEEIA